MFLAPCVCFQESLSSKAELQAWDTIESRAKHQLRCLWCYRKSQNLRFVDEADHVIRSLGLTVKSSTNFCSPRPSFFNEKSKHITSFHVLIAKGVKKHNTAENIAGSGLNLSHLHKIFQRDGEDGLRATFVQRNSEGQARVYSTKLVLDS